MFCPKCAANLVQQDGELKCSASKMGFSRSMERVLSHRYGKHEYSGEGDRSFRANVTDDFG
jgi:hypothetical protein